MDKAHARIADESFQLERTDDVSQLPLMHVSKSVSTFLLIIATAET